MCPPGRLYLWLSPGFEFVESALETQVAPPPAAALLGLDRIDDEPERRNPKPGPPWRINTACQEADQCRGDRGADELRALVAG